MRKDGDVEWLKDVKFASISDQLINTAIILDMMFNTEMIVKDMKGGKEDMTEKQDSDVEWQIVKILRCWGSLKVMI